MTEPSHGLKVSLQHHGEGALDIQFESPARGITALFGPSGAGKTRCLRMVAGLDRGQGTVRLGAQAWQDSARGVFVPVHRRGIGYVFQEASLLPHLNVRGNIDYGFRRSGRAAALDREGWIDRFAIRPLLDRRVGALSGGERQRVAIVRALLSRPSLLLFDEPLSGLDDGARSSLLGMLERAHAQLAVPMIYVSHLIDEVARLADHLVVLDGGCVRAQGTLQSTLTRMDLPPALMGAAGAVIEGTLHRVDALDGLAELVFAGGSLWLPHGGGSPGDAQRCRISARDVVLSLERATDTSALNQLRCRVLSMGDADHPSQCLVQLDAHGVRLLARITRRSWHALGLSQGSEVWAQFKAVALGA